MIKTIYFLFFICISVLLDAQSISNYTFTAGNLGYVNETGTPVTLSSGNKNDGYANSIDMGFDFWYMGTRYTHAGISTNGWMTLGTGSTAISNSTPSNSFSVAGSTVTRPTIAPLWDDLDFTESAGSITYLTSGIAPNRIFTVEWKNAEWGANTNGAVISFKVKLHETSGKITYQYQQGSTPVSGASASIGISGNSNTIYQSLNNSSANPTTSTAISTTNINTLPDNGQTYSFTPPLLPAPSNITFSNVTINSMNMNWVDNSTAETGYAIFMSTDNVNFYFIGRVAANTTTFALGGLYTGMPYYFRVYTISEGSFSAAASGNRSTLNGTMSGTYTIPGNYPTIKAAIAAIQANGVLAKVVLELQNNYTGAGETYPIDVPTTLGNTMDKTITLRPAANVTSVAISGSSNTSIITLNGAKFFIIDGRPGGTGTTKALKIHNTLVPSAVPNNIVAVSLINDACNDTIRYCDILSEGYSVASIGTSWGGIGNNSNSIEYCVIRGGQSSNSSDLFISTGTAGKINSSNTLAFNEFYDFAPQAFTPGGSPYPGTSVINIGANCTDYRLIGNHIYQPASATSFTTQYYQVGISFNNTSGKVTIRNNYIGGSAPSCGGSAWEFGPSSASTSITPVRVLCSFAEPSFIEGNTISNFILGTQGRVINYDMASIWASGACRIKNNTVGSTLTTGAIEYFIPASQSNNIMVYGIVGTDSITNNTVSGIKINGPNTSGNITLIGILGSNQAVTENLVGSLTTANSLWLNSPTAVQHTLTGISATSVIANNTVINLSNAAIQYGVTNGITGFGLISGNSISKLNASSSTLADAIAGIKCQNVSTPTTISRNSIHSFTSADGADVTGIILTNSSTDLVCEISQNDIHSLEQPAGSTRTITGIRVIGSGNINNNMIHLGLNADGSSMTTSCPITGITNNGGARLVVHNSIYIGGANVANGTANTACLQNISASAGTMSFYNNIVCNARTNASTGGIHYLLNDVGMNSDFNIFYTYGAPFVIRSSQQYNSLSAYKTGRSKDLNSTENDPKFINTNGNAASIDLHIQPLVPTWVEGHGTSAYSTLVDFDGQTRTGHTDIGADAGNFTGVPVQWLSFDAKLIDAKEVKLSWQTASEKNNKQFDVERSYDGVDFMYVSSVKGNGNISSISSYQYTDHIPEGSASKIYYRLKQIDFNGEHDYSKTRLVERSEDALTAGAYPNPFTNRIMIQSGTSSGICSVKVTDAFGKLIIEKLFEAGNLSLSTTTWNNGVYFVQLTSEDGIEKVIKLVK